MSYFKSELEEWYFLFWTSKADFLVASKLHLLVALERTAREEELLALFEFTLLSTVSWFTSAQLV